MSTRAEYVRLPSRRQGACLGSMKKLRPNVFGGVQDDADHDAIGLGRVENEMRLEAKAPIAGPQLVHRLADAREVREKAEGAFQTGVIGVRLAGSEPGFGEVVNVDEVSAGAIGKPKASHAGARPRAAARRQEYRSCCRR